MQLLSHVVLSSSLTTFPRLARRLQKTANALVNVIEQEAAGCCMVRWSNVDRSWIRISENVPLQGTLWRIWAPSCSDPFLSGPPLSPFHHVFEYCSLPFSEFHSTCLSRYNVILSPGIFTLLSPFLG
jgi:hypothetical protein